VSNVTTLAPEENSLKRGFRKRIPEREKERETERERQRER
jgi:hypothetical protein